MLRFSLISCLLLLLFVGCVPMAALRFPDPAAVTKIEVTGSGNYNFETGEHDGKITIMDPREIEEVMNILESVNSRMRGAATTFPTPTHTISFTDTSGTNLVMWIGVNWIGGRNNLEGSPSNNRLRPLHGEERTKLFRILGIEDDGF